MAIAYVCEAHNAMASDAVAAERRYRQMLVATRSYELRMLLAQEKVRRLKDRVDMLVNLALDEATTSGAGSQDGDSNSGTGLALLRL